MEAGESNPRKISIDTTQCELDATRRPSQVDVQNPAQQSCHGGDAQEIREGEHERY
jgi:hypothetical protein